MDWSIIAESLGVRLGSKLGSKLGSTRPWDSPGGYFGIEELSRMWKNTCNPEANHPFLSKWRIEAHGARCIPGEDWLILPAHAASGELRGLLYFGAGRYRTGCFGDDGSFEGYAIASHAMWERKFLRGCRYVMGSKEMQGRSANVVCVTRHFVVGAMLRQATNLPVVLTFCDHNLYEVAKDLRKRGASTVLLIGVVGDSNSTTDSMDYRDLELSVWEHEAKSLDKSELLLIDPYDEASRAEIAQSVAAARARV